MRTFADTFQPHQQALNQGQFAKVVNPMLIGSGANDDGKRLLTAHDQVRHHKLWNYVAVDRIAARMSQMAPIVGRVRGGKGAGSAVTHRQRQHIARNYSFAHVGPSDRIELVQDLHPLAYLLTHVNPRDWWGSFFYELVMFLEHTGEAYIWAIPDRDTKLPSELWVVPTHWIQPQYDTRRKVLTHYKVTPDGDSTRKQEIPADEIIVIQYKSPLSKSHGWSPNRAGAEWIDNAESIERSRKQSFANGPNPGAVLELDPVKFSDPSAAAIDEIRDRFRRKYGGSRNAGEPIVTPPGVSVKPWTHTPEEMDYTDSAGDARDAVLALRGVPKVIAGIANDVNKASIFGANLIFCESTITPRLAYVAGALTEKLARRFGDDLLIWFDDCRPQDDEAEREEMQLDWELGALTPDERRVERGREPLNTEASQQTYVSGSVKRLEDVATDPADPSTPGSDDNDDGDDTDSGSLGDTDGDTGDSDSSDDSNSGPGGEGDTGESQALSGHCPVHGSTARPTRINQDVDGERVRRLFLRLHSALERLLHKALGGFWRRRAREADKVVSGFDADGYAFPTAAELTPEESFRTDFNKTSRPHWKSQIRSGIDLEADIVALDPDNPFPDIEVKISPKMRRDIDQFLDGREDGVWRKVLGSTREQLENAIADGVEDGDSAKDIAKRVRKVLGNSKRESIVIARTETTASMNYGQELLRQEEGIPFKRWISTLDSRTRQTHLASNEQRVPQAEPFLVGGSAMMFPGDGSRGAPAEEIVNCRCTSVGAFSE